MLILRLLVQYLEWISSGVSVAGCEYGGFSVCTNVPESGLTTRAEKDTVVLFYGGALIQSCIFVLPFAPVLQDKILHCSSCIS